MLKPRILLDIDGCIADCVGPMLAAFGRDLGLTLTYEELTSYNTIPFIKDHVENPEAYLAQLFWGQGFMVNQPVRLDAVQGYPRLRGIADQIHIVTARDIEQGKHVRTETEQWLTRYGFGCDRLAFDRDKIVYAKTHNLHYIIEDAPHTAEKAQRNGFGVILVDAPYNRDVPNLSRLWRVDSINEAPAIIEADWVTLKAKAK